MTIPGLQRLRQQREVDAVGLTEACLERIRAHDPLLRAVLALNPLATMEARASDRRRETGDLRGPLDGIPILLKDSIDTAGLATTAGSRALLGAPPARDAELVRRLRAAGAVILGKTNLTEWGNFRSVRSTSGWSAVGGQTRNPHAPGRSPSGSSSGSAAGVAAGFAQVAVGVETDGSIVFPAGVNGVVGLKPSVGTISQHGLVPISARQDTAGPMARHVTDVALTFAVLTGGDAAVGLATDALRGARIGLWRMPSYGIAVDHALDGVAQDLRTAGAEVVEVEVADAGLGDLAAEVLPTEFREGIDAYLATRQDAPGNLAELIEYHRGDPLEQSCFPDLDLFDLALNAAGPDNATYRARRVELTALARQAIDGPLTTHRLDAIAAPTNMPAWPIDCAAGDPALLSTSTPAAVAGYPHVTVPAMVLAGLPVGLSFMAGRRADDRVLALAASYERLADARRSPRLPPQTDAESASTTRGSS